MTPPRRSPTLKRDEVVELFSRLRELNPRPTTELEYGTPFELLVAVTLSAQATDVGVNKATRRLFPVANTPAAILALGEDGLKNYISTIGLFNAKAKNVIATCRILIERYGGEVPRSREALEWTDEAVRHDWRLQRRPGTATCRILDPGDGLVRDGTADECRAAFAALEASGRVPPVAGETVILLHGLGEGRASMEPLADHLRRIPQIDADDAQPVQPVFGIFEAGEPAHGVAGEAGGDGGVRAVAQQS